MEHLNPRDLIEAARDVARQSRDLMADSLAKVRPPLTKEAMTELLTQRMNLVMDCYLTGAADMLKRLHGDTTPEPWEDDYNHEARLTELLTDFNLLRRPKT